MLYLKNFIVFAAIAAVASVAGLADAQNVEHPTVRQRLGRG